MNEPLVLVRWRDAWFDFEASIGEWLETYEVHTVGFLVRDDGNVISLAQESLQSGDWRAITHIPKACVLEIVKLWLEQDVSPPMVTGVTEIRRPS
jgi:hypothetical protein